MTTTTKQRLLIAFSSVLVGCAVGATMPRLAAQSFPPNPQAQRWEQVCEDTDDYDIATTTRWVAARGNQGFELVSTTLVGSDIWLCFKRPAPR